LTGFIPAPKSVPPVLGARVPNVSSQVPGFVVEYRNQPVDETPLGFAVPLSVAPVAVIDVAAFDNRDGAAPGVVNCNTDPKEIPPEFWLTAQKKYVVAGDRPLIACEYGTSEFPEPRSLPPAAGARVPKMSLHVPGFAFEYLNHPVAAEPFGFPVPFNVAVLVVTVVGALVVTTAVWNWGVNDCTAPKDVPGELWAIAQK
jgi:hypothetical protein